MYQQCYLRLTEYVICLINSLTKASSIGANFVLWNCITAPLREVKTVLLFCMTPSLNEISMFKRKH